MTIDIQAIRDAIERKPACWRDGQAAFNKLDEIDHEAAIWIGGSACDPYARDEALGDFFAELERMNESGDW